MGFSLSWLAIRGKDPAIVRRELGVRGTGSYEELPEAPLQGVDLPTGWYLVVADHCSLEETESVARLSLGGEVVTCFVEEHVMCSRASGWRDGRRLWSITHDWQRGIEHLEADGDLPPVFDPIRDHLTAEQLGQDHVDFIFDIPIEVAKALTGFRHDQDPPVGPLERYEILERCRREKK
jgi:hypothetical protein